MSAGQTVREFTKSTGRPRPWPVKKTWGRLVKKSGGLLAKAPESGTRIQILRGFHVDHKTRIFISYLGNLPTTALSTGLVGRHQRVLKR